MLMKSGGHRPPAAVRSAGNRTPTGISVGVGSIVVVVAAMLAALIPRAHTDWRFAVVAVAVGLLATFTRDWLATAAVAVLAWLVVDGFLVDRMGELSWHGSADRSRFVLLILAGGAGLMLGEGAAALREWRMRWRAAAYLQARLSRHDERDKRDA